MSTTLALSRESNVFAERQDLRERLEKEHRTVLLAPDQLLHADSPATYVVRLGKLRVSEFRPDGREITRAVLQAGSFFDVADETRAADPAADVYILNDLILMAYGEVELWQLAPGLLDA
ncbi:MAG: hypothetical protein GY838_16030 [bacterium]|nr:hypothetical protein [bacterium]